MAVTIHPVKRKSAQDENGVQVSERTLPDKPASPFDAIFNEHWIRVCAVLYRLTGDRDEAEDLALETFWRMYRHPPRDLNLAGWLYRVATHLGLNALRSRQRRRRYEEEAGVLDLNRRAPLDPAVEVENAEQRRMVRQVLAGMNPRSARLLILRHSGLSYTEIAAALALAPTSVGSLLARAEREFEKRYLDLERRSA